MKPTVKTKYKDMTAEQKAGLKKVDGKEVVGIAKNFGHTITFFSDGTEKITDKDGNVKQSWPSENKKAKK